MFLNSALCYIQIAASILFEVSGNHCPFYTTSLAFSKEDDLHWERRASQKEKKKEFILLEIRS